MAAEDTTSKKPSEDEAVALALREEEMAKYEQEREDAFDSLAKSIESKYFFRAQKRAAKEDQWRKSMELYLGNLSVEGFVELDKPFSTSRNTNRPYYNLIANKCDIAIAQSVDMQFAGGEKNWSLGPPVNNKDPEVSRRAGLMEKEIEAQFERCAYGRKVRRAIEDRVIYGTGILKGPVNTGKVYNKYEPLPGTDMWVPKPAVDKEPSIEWVNPWFFFPDTGVNEFSQCGDTIEVHPASAYDLKKLRNHPGFIPEAIEWVLKETSPATYLNDSYADFVSITESNPYLFQDKYMLLEYHGPITATDLDKLDVDPPAYDPINNEYYGEVWVCAGKVVRIELENIEASFEVPYGVSVWKKDPSSLFGFGSPLLMKDAQRVARETWRMILDNASLSSGPQIALHRSYVEPQNGEWELAPNKAWNLLDSAVDVEKAIQFFNVPNMTGALLPILDMARQMAEEESMTPMLAGGLQGADTQESATGQLMMKEASTTVLDFLSEDWDDNITEKIVRRTYGWNMQYNPNPEIKGNYSVDVRTATEFKNKQMVTRDLERLGMQMSQNPEAAMVINAEELFRAQLATMHLPSQSIIRSDEEIAKMREAQAQQPSPEAQKLQVDMERIKTENRKIDLQEAQLQFELKAQQRREEMDHIERMGANQARMTEAQAAILKVQTEKEIAFLTLAQQMEDGEKKNSILAAIAIREDATKRFMAQADADAKARDQILTAKEMQIKLTEGSGI